MMWFYVAMVCGNNALFYHSDEIVNHLDEKVSTNIWNEQNWKKFKRKKGKGKKLKRKILKWKQY